MKKKTMLIALIMLATLAPVFFIGKINLSRLIVPLFSTINISD